MTLAVIAAIITSLVIAARLRPGPWAVVACRILAIVILANEAAWWIWLGDHKTWSASYALPFQLCDVAGIVSAAALWSRHPLLVELTYFWALPARRTASSRQTSQITSPALVSCSTSSRTVRSWPRLSC